MCHGHISSKIKRGIVEFTKNDGATLLYDVLLSVCCAYVIRKNVDMAFPRHIF